MGVIFLLVVVSPPHLSHHFFLFYLHVIAVLVSQNSSIHHIQPPKLPISFNPHTHQDLIWLLPYFSESKTITMERTSQLSQHVIIAQTPYPLFISTLATYLSPPSTPFLSLSLSFFSTWRWHHTRWTTHMTDPNLILLQQHQRPASILFNATSDVFFI